MPDDYPNQLNRKSKGLIPVAILGDAGFDVTTIHPDSILLETTAPVRWAIEDVNTDGFDDMTLKFGCQSIIAVLDDVSGGDEIQLHLTGFSEGTGGEYFIGSDFVVIK